MKAPSPRSRVSLEAEVGSGVGGFGRCFSSHGHPLLIKLGGTSAESRPGFFRLLREIFRDGVADDPGDADAFYIGELFESGFILGSKAQGNALDPPVSDGFAGFDGRG